MSHKQITFSSSIASEDNFFFYIYGGHKRQKHSRDKIGISLI